MGFVQGRNISQMANGKCLTQSVICICEYTSALCNFPSAAPVGRSAKLGGGGHSVPVRANETIAVGGGNVDSQSTPPVLEASSCAS